MEQKNNKTTMVQHWQDMYNAYEKGGNNNWLFRDRAVTGLTKNTILKWNVPTYLRDDLHQMILLAVDKSFNTYDPTKCDILLPYVLNGVRQQVYSFLNTEMYSGTFGSTHTKNSERFITTLPQVCGKFVDPLEEEERLKDEEVKMKAFENWLREVISDPVDFSIYCHQKGVFNHEKLNNEETAEKLHIDIEKVKKVKACISSKICQRLNTKNLVKNLGPLGYYYIKSIRNGNNEKQQH